MRYHDLPNEATLKNAVARDFFNKFDCTEILGGVDFTVRAANGAYLLWAEAKIKPTDALVMLAQLVLTIGKARTFDTHLPPPFLACFDCEKIAFVPYSNVQDIFYQNLRSPDNYARIAERHMRT